MAGCYIVFGYPQGDQNPYDIGFQLKEGIAQVPDEQSALKSEIERTLHVLCGVFSPTDRRFKQYFVDLLALSQYGLVGDAAQPEQAIITLKNLQKRFLDREKGRAIGAYMLPIIRDLAIGVSALAIAGIAGLVTAIYAGWVDSPSAIVPYLTVLLGLGVGLLFSTIMRCRAVSFYDLHAIEADRFAPWMKILFAFVTLMVMGAFLKAGVVEIEIGQLPLSSFDTNALSAFVFGILVGIGQDVLIARIESIGKRIELPKQDTGTT